MRDEYDWNTEYLNNPHRVAPVHVTNRGFVTDAGSQDLVYDSLYAVDAPRLTHEQRQFAVARGFTFAGQYVPLRLSDLHEPIVTGLPVPTVGIEDRGQYVPQVVMHAPDQQDWQSVTW